MLRVRFHGRGGHGVKTAGRILGTAAFLGGRQVQDSPIYGPERRGAAMAAFTRIDAGPIRERGAMPDPDLIVVADETLFADPAAGVLAGREFASAAFVNSARDGPAVAAEYGVPCPVHVADLTAVTVEVVGRGTALSATLGAVACGLAGLAEADTLRAVRQELTAIHLPADLVEKNVEAARRAFAVVPAAAFRERPAPGPAPAAPHPPEYLPGPEGMPIILAPGNSARRHTGSWRVARPVIDPAACTRCGICLTLCPDAAVQLDDQGYPVIDFDNCKGCMICRRECPVHCIGEEKEVRAW